VNRKPLKIGLSPRFLHRVPPEPGFRGKTLQYFELRRCPPLAGTRTVLYDIERCGQQAGGQQDAGTAPNADLNRSKQDE
jgi:hypothetical protein